MQEDFLEKVKTICDSLNAGLEYIMNDPSISEKLKLEAKRLVHKIVIDKEYIKANEGKTIIRYDEETFLPIFENPVVPFPYEK